MKSHTLENKTEWQKLTLDFESDGQASTIIQLAAIHTSTGSEKIIGFDNIVIEKQPISIGDITTLIGNYFTSGSAITLDNITRLIEQYINQ